MKLTSKVVVFCFLLALMANSTPVLGQTGASTHASQDLQTGRYSKGTKPRLKKAQYFCMRAILGIGSQLYAYEMHSSSPAASAFGEWSHMELTHIFSPCLDASALGCSIAARCVHAWIQRPKLAPCNTIKSKAGRQNVTQQTMWHNMFCT